MGLVQRVLEAMGIPTVALSMIPDLTRAVGVPRLAGISYPFGRPLGQPHDADGQRAVLRAMLELLATASGPDTYVELPFQWPESPARARNACPKRSGGASPKMSIGLCRDQCGGSTRSNRETVAGDRFASLQFFSSNASQAITPGPPAFVTIASRLP